MSDNIKIFTDEKFLIYDKKSNHFCSGLMISSRYNDKVFKRLEEIPHVTYVKNEINIIYFLREIYRIQQSNTPIIGINFLDLSIVKFVIHFSDTSKPYATIVDEIPSYFYLDLEFKSIASKRRK